MEKKDYNKFIQMINLEGIEIESLNCVKNNKFTRGNGKKINIKIDHEVIDASRNGVDLLIPFKLDVMAFYQLSDKSVGAEFSENETLFKISLILNLNYKLKIEDSDAFSVNLDEEIAAFSSNVTLNAWPYAREVVSSMTTRMGLPPYSLPTFAFIQGD